MSLGEAGVATGGSDGGSGSGGGSAPASGVGAGAPASNPGSTGAPSTGGTPPASGDGGLGKGGQNQTSWRESLSDDLKSDPTLSKYSDVSNLAKAHIELQKKFGQKGIFKPQPGASADEIKAFREAIGIPTDPTKYDLGKFEGVNVPPETVQWAQKLGAEAGVEPQAMNKIITDYFKLDAQVKQAQQKTTQESIKAGFDGLRKEWGDAFQRNIDRANLAAEKMGGKPFIDALKKAGVDNDATILKALAESAKWLGEDTLKEGGAGSSVDSPEELDVQISQARDQLLKTPKGTPAYTALSAKHASLWRRKTGGK